MQNMQFYSSLFVIICLFSCEFGLSRACEELPDVVKHCTRISCEVTVDDAGVETEISTFECEYGYEFKAGVTIESFETFGGKIDEEIQCNAIGCKFKDMPRSDTIDPEANIILTYSVCAPAILQGHCRAEDSYVDFKCKPGFKMDGDTGFLTVKCLLSYLWDTTPMCDIPDPQTPTTPITTALTTTRLSTITTALATTKPVTTTPTADVTACPDVWPKPAYYNRTNVTMNLIPHEIVKNVWLPNSTITFSCLYGYFPNRKIRELTTLCLPNGTWTRVPDCELHPCWGKLPQRPLNGRRDVWLYMTNTEYTNGSYVNFSCNPFYELVGRDRLYCYGYQWEQEVPECRLQRRVCLLRPEPLMVGNAFVKQVSKVELTHEVDYSRNKSIILYTSADYACMPKYRFLNNATTIVKMYDDSKKGGGGNVKVLPVQVVNCSDYNQWMTPPVCVPYI